MMETTLTGALQILFTALVMFSGGKLEHYGMSLSYNLQENRLHITPILVFDVSKTWMGNTTVCQYGCGVNIAGTSVYKPAVYRGNLLYSVDTMIRYELGHTAGWNHFGLEYGLRIFSNPCDYDPGAMWANCGAKNNLERLTRNVNPSSLLPTTGSFSIRF